MKWVLLAIILTNFGTLLYERALAAMLTVAGFGQQLEVSPTLRIRTKFGFRNIQNHQEESTQKAEAQSIQAFIAAQWLIDAWAWVFFAINTSLTASIMYKIMSVASLSLPSLYPRVRC
jgi:hypothetical protein